jgi:hypothetical protein
MLIKPRQKGRGFISQNICVIALKICNTYLPGRLLELMSTLCHVNRKLMHIPQMRKVHKTVLLLFLMPLWENSCSVINLT